MTIKISINSKSCTTFTTDVQNVRRFDASTEVLTPFSHLSAGWGTSSSLARDGRSSTVDTRDAGFHTSVAVAAQQSGCKACGL